MFKNKLCIEIKGQDERVYQFYCENSSPLGELYDALSVMKANVRKLMEEHDKKENEKKEEPEAQEEQKEDE